MSQKPIQGAVCRPNQSAGPPTKTADEPELCWPAARSNDVLAAGDVDFPRGRWPTSRVARRFRRSRWDLVFAGINGRRRVTRGAGLGGHHPQPVPRAVDDRTTTPLVAVRSSRRTIGTATGTPRCPRTPPPSSPRHATLDAAAATHSGCDGSRDHRSFRDRRAAPGCDRSRDHRSFRDRSAYDADSSDTCRPEGHCQSPTVAVAWSASIEAMIA